MKMRMKKSISLLAVCLLVVGILTGCGTKFDAGKYVQAQLDNSFKNDSSLIVEQKIAEADEAKEVYEQGIDTVVDNFFLGVTVSDDLKARYKEIFQKMFEKAEYTIKESAKQDDGSYTVTIEYKKMKFFEPALEQLKDKAEDMNSDDVNDYFEALADIMEGIINDGVEYGDAKTMDIHVEIQNKVYTINSTDIQTLNNEIFDFDKVQ
ncbi:MAG: hypothetical protein PUF65_02330 [Lachnospiraceae bacterium]|nr:hypothetical protein [Lachnospiraceae bacterium]